MALPASRGPGRPPAAKADETRKRIIGAARQVFSERGYDGATFQAIALRADLTRPAINHYFSSKRLLYREVADQTNGILMMESIERAQREATLMGRFTVFIEHAMSANSEHPAASAFVVTHVLESQRHPELSADEDEAVVRAREFLAWVVTDGIKNGEVRSDIDVEALVEALLVVLCGVGFYAGYLEGAAKMGALTGVLRQLMAGALWHTDA
ncbi:TetR family transcriptional regulator [Mycobacterium intermedium]|uniref:TetR family transcriptional regulator n=1 Tax=Mycobacterium intermedium TaxID=28445 RepID=A0A1E3SKB3_MYCIE|nr:TetR/AcrR family transcriptional regulator [Mycobacterium intermedium]MCV6962863.1 TetR/AcrR family transcriptional regulator [Mycobacterium intermedium]ODR02587.1 TetR family transcriptional regulator [Mycobacterium intermedium]OPE50379.1 TetR family transcriptional regulator [Mycobacterium intermedium]ORB09954.1 TetR family transcriptional regulator [Mycobacterium intermedium]